MEVSLYLALWIKMAQSFLQSMKIDTPDGKRQLHETVTAFYQHKSVKQNVYENLKPELKRISGRRVLNHSLHQ